MGDEDNDTAGEDDGVACVGISAGVLSPTGLTDYPVTTVGLTTEVC